MTTILPYHVQSHRKLNSVCVIFFIDLQTILTDKKSEIDVVIRVIGVKLVFV
jgi:hypothetical protein